MTSSVQGLSASSVSNVSQTQISVLADETLLKIFSYLCGEDIVRCSAVSRRFRRITLHDGLWKNVGIRRLSPSLKIFDGSDWERHVNLSSAGLMIEELPPLNKRELFRAVKEISSEVEGGAGLTLLTIPKGLTFNKIRGIGSFLREGSDAAQFACVHDPIEQKLGTVQVDRTYRVLISNSVLKGSRALSIAYEGRLARLLGYKKSDEIQRKLLSDKKCEMPKMLEVVTLLVATYMSAGQRLYNRNPMTYTRCLEEVDGEPVVVGGFGSSGFNVYHYFDKYGVACTLQKF